jgi:nitrogen regulatory protein P-II 1
MKEIKAIIQPHMLSKVMEALHALPHFPGVTVSDCQGQGRGRGVGGHFEATNENVFFPQRQKIEILCADSAADELVQVIQAAAHTGNPGDGLIVVAEPSRVVRIRTGQEQQEAV